MKLCNREANALITTSFHYQRTMIPLLIITLACLVAPLLGSVAPSPAPSGPTPAPSYFRQEEIEAALAENNQARAQWDKAGITTYNHIQQFSWTIPPEWRQPISVQVVDDSLVSRTFEDGTSVDDAQDSYFSRFVVPINDQFDFIGRKTDNYNVLTVSYNETLGYPTYVSWRPIQPGGGYIQEPIIFSIQNLRPGTPSPTAEPTSPPTASCPIFGCCVEDCCGPKTVWDESVEYCIPSASSSGWNGTYDLEFEFGCVERVCCEDTCCGEGTKYSQILAFCISVGTPTGSPSACVCGFPELFCDVEGWSGTGMSCTVAGDCPAMGCGGLVMCKPEGEEFPPECADDSGCYYESECPLT